MTAVTFPRLGRLGRLKQPGNQLFQLAGTLAVANRLGVGLSLPPWEHAKWFSVPAGVFTDGYGNDADQYVPELGVAAPYFQDYRLVESVADIIREWLKPSDLSLELIGSMRIRHGHRTAVHVRRGDYLNLPDHYVVPPVDWYVKAMIAAQRRNGATRFELFSDDPAWCRHHFPDCEVISHPAPPGHEVLRDGDGHPLGHPEEMADWWRMTSASSVIAANSAFSWWAAWLSGDPHPIVPAKWYGPANGHLSEARLIPPTWTAL